MDTLQHIRTRVGFYSVLAGCFLLLNVTGLKAQQLDPDYAVFDQQPEAIYGSQALYQVNRNGKKIGQHSLRFSREQQQLLVETESDLAVRMLGITLYTYRYISKEHWQAQNLIKVSTRIFDHRKPEKVIVAQPRDKLLHISNGGVSKIAAMADFPSNHWHPAVLSAKRVFHTLHGKVYKIDLQSLGWEKVALASGDVISARRYRYQSGFLADVWYDKAHRWVKLRFKADDGSNIEYSCVDCGR